MIRMLVHFSELPVYPNSIWLRGSQHDSRKTIMLSVIKNFALCKWVILSKGSSRNTSPLRLVLFLRCEVCISVIYFRVAYSNFESVCYKFDVERPQRLGMNQCSRNANDIRVYPKLPYRASCDGGLNTCWTLLET